eukprot:g758.t1
MRFLLGYHKYKWKKKMNDVEMMNFSSCIFDRSQPKGALIADLERIVQCCEAYARKGVPERMRKGEMKEEEEEGGSVAAQRVRVASLMFEELKKRRSGGPGFEKKMLQFEQRLARLDSLMKGKRCEKFPEDVEENKTEASLRQVEMAFGAEFAQELAIQREGRREDQHVREWMVELLMTSAEEIEAHRSRVALKDLDILRSRLGLDGTGNQGSRSPQLLDDSKADAIRERRKQLESGILDLVHELKDLSTATEEKLQESLAQLEHTDELIEKNEAKTDQINKETKAELRASWTSVFAQIFIVFAVLATTMFTVFYMRWFSKKW